MTRLACLFVASALMPLPAAAQDAAEPTRPETKQEATEPKSMTTRHSVRIDGKEIEYSATVGWLIMTDDEDKPVARFGYTAYTRDGVDDLSRRPILFPRPRSGWTTPTASSTRPTW